VRDERKKQGGREKKEGSARDDKKKRGKLQKKISAK
jgi:hypothetical protein